jgi:hypothetical protein
VKPRKERATPEIAQRSAQDRNAVVGATWHAQLATTDPIPARASDLRLGTTRDGSFFPGEIDELAIYDRALSLADVARHHDAGRAP